MILAASQGQRQLCRGQGAELLWSNHPVALASTQVLEIFRSKTAPAFEVALKIGATLAGKLDDTADALHEYSEALGIAYQIRDDLSDLGQSGETNDIEGLRPSLLLAIAYERAQPDKKAALESVWRRQPGLTPAEIENLYKELRADERAQTLLETYKEEAIRSLREVDNANLKGLLRRVIGKIFNDTEIKGWCKEFELKNLGAARAENQLAEPRA